MDKATLSVMRTIARCSAIARSLTEEDRCKIDSDYFTAMCNDIFDDMILKEFNKLQGSNTEQSWANNPDRSGGQFTDEEINRGNW